MTRRFGSRRALIILGAVLIVAVGAGVMIARSRHGKATVVQTEEVRRGVVEEMVAATGRVQPQSEVKISANVSGRIERLPVAEGDSVLAGQLLVEIDRTRYRALVSESQAGLRSARADLRLETANLEQATREHDRRKRMNEQGLASAGDLEAAETALKVSAARRDAAREAVQRAEALLIQSNDDLSKTTILAPMNGIITRVNVEVGEMVLGTSQNVGTTIMTLADLGQMEVLAEVDESEVVKLSLGDSTSIEVDAVPGRIFSGTVSEIANSATTRGRGTAEETTHFEVKVAFRGDVSALRPGMSATVDILSDRRDDVLHLPIQCVTLRAKPGEGDDLAGPSKGKKGKGKGKHKGGGGEEGDEARADEGPPRAGEQPWEEERRREREIASNLREVVFVVRNGAVHEVPVETGISSATEIEIRGGGLREGDEVVAGSYRVLSRDLEDGDRIKVDNESVRRVRRGGNEAQHARGQGGRSEAGDNRSREAGGSGTAAGTQSGGTTSGEARAATRDDG